jgi:hypothetical protein
MLDVLPFDLIHLEGTVRGAEHCGSFQFYLIELRKHGASIRQHRR